MTDEIQQVFDRAGQGNQFLTGKAGTGKTTTARELMATTKLQTIITAFTGVAALNAGGQTIHALMRFPYNVTPEEAPNRSPRDPDLFRHLELLVVDEVSMCRADLFDSVAAFLRRHGPRPGQPFGGVTVLAVGDPYQLPPMVTNNDLDFQERYTNPFFFGADSYANGDFMTTELTHPFRQVDDDFLAALDGIRGGTASDQDLELLNQRVVANVTPSDLQDSDSTMLTTHRKQADDMNDSILTSLPGVTRVFKAKVEGHFPESSYPTTTELRLKKGAKVMMLVNKPPHWVNGSVGTVVDIAASGVRVRLVDGRAVTVEPHNWEQIGHRVVNGNIVSEAIGTFSQLPLRLSWAITIHKCQGLSLNRAVINLGKQVFACGQLYVALSRLRTIEGLTITPRPIRRSDIMVDPRVREFMEGR
jgi:hypothetical protein